MKRFFAILVFFAIFHFTAGDIFASSFYLSPKDSNIYSGDTIAVDVVINTNNESINGVSAYLSYPSDKIEVEWITYGEAFSVQAEESYGEGSIKISRGSFSGETGDVTIATVGFKGIAVGDAEVSFVEGSYAPRTIDSSDSLNLYESTGATLKVVQPQQVQVKSKGRFCFLLGCFL